MTSVPTSSQLTGSSRPKGRGPITSQSQSHYNISFPTQHVRGGHHSFNRVRFDLEHRSSAHTLIAKTKHGDVAQRVPFSLSIPDRRVHSAISTRSQHGMFLVRLNAHDQKAVSRTQVPRVEQPPIGPSDNRQEPASAKLILPLPISSHSRTALDPCLSSSPKIECLISTVSPAGGCEKLLQTIYHSSPILDQSQMMEAVNEYKKDERKAGTLSPSWCSPNIFSAADIGPSCHTGHNHILSLFLKNNGRYLDDSDDDEQEEEEEEGGHLVAISNDAFHSVRATDAFLKRIYYPTFELRPPLPSAQTHRSQPLHPNQSGLLRQLFISPMLLEACPPCRTSFYYFKILVS